LLAVCVFAGKDEVDQLEKIFSIMGQPTEQSMPGCTSYPNYQTACGGGVAQRFPPVSKLRQHCSQRGVTDPQALNLLEALLALNPAARIKAQAAVTVRACSPAGFLQLHLHLPLTAPVVLLRSARRSGGVWLK
jgi:hypothetical protein